MARNGQECIDAVTAADIREVMLTIEKRDARDVARRAHESTGQVFRSPLLEASKTEIPLRNSSRATSSRKRNLRILLAFEREICPGC